MEMYNIVWGNYVLNKKPSNFRKGRTRIEGSKVL
jgi:hypothetical protein